MFQPRSFQQKDINENLKFIAEFPLATLISQGSKGIEANHIPMIVKKEDEEVFLEGHIAKANSLFKNTEPGTEVFCIFHGPNAYISPEWYPSKQKGGKEVPTWNYVVVHVKGEIQFKEDSHWIYQHLDELSQINEKKLSSNWKITDAPDDYISRMIKAVIGIRIKVSQIIGQTKMSQNHPEENRQGVIKGLSQNQQQNVADWVNKPRT